MTVEQFISAWGNRYVFDVSIKEPPEKRVLWRASDPIRPPLWSGPADEIPEKYRGREITSFYVPKHDFENIDEDFEILIERQ